MTKWTVLLLFVLLAIEAQAKKAKDWEELESILEDIDEAKNGQKQNTQQVQSAACENHVCGWGKECVVDKKNRPVCECISKCPAIDNDPLDQVCSSNNQTFPSLCELYRQRLV